MANRSPAIACIGVIGKQNNPLHISLFPSQPNLTQSTSSQYGAARDPLEFSFLLSSSLDIFEARLPHKPLDQDFGLLQAVDERLAMYGYLTNTGVRFVIVIDMEGRVGGADSKERGAGGASGVRDADLKPAFRALQMAYIGLLRNPFYDPDEHNPSTASGVGSTQITSPKFIKEVKRIGDAWVPGVTSL